MLAVLHYDTFLELMCQKTPPTTTDGTMGHPGSKFHAPSFFLFARGTDYRFGPLSPTRAPFIQSALRVPQSNLTVPLILDK